MAATYNLTIPVPDASPPVPGAPPPAPFRRIWIRSAIFAAIAVVTSLATTIIGGMIEDREQAHVIGGCLYATFTGACLNALCEFFAIALDGYMQQNQRQPQPLSAKWKAAGAAFLSYILCGLLQVPSVVLAGLGIPRLVTKATLCVLFLSLCGSFFAHYGNAPFVKTTLWLLFGGAAAFLVSFGSYKVLYRSLYRLY